MILLSLVDISNIDDEFLEDGYPPKDPRDRDCSRPSLSDLFRKVLHSLWGFETIMPQNGPRNSGLTSSRWSCSWRKSRDEAGT
ncbi:hypothetical protein AXF42_Ash014027 [Apostasia shenzhenica]|uniref:Uncharacterized protein n=1 Tax=Apostasia shenzhenica TaxID=1088818 RepID=A0A2I0A972_9ASPA|nr:hypothetical protein AXF42_Ash014027 [Apostasia shenzhenica]